MEGHCSAFFNEYGCPNLVSMADGTLFPFAFAPKTQDAPDYSGRKYGYSLTAFIVCDCYHLIHFILTGWPGSAHDNHVFTNTQLFQWPHDFFADSNEYLLAPVSMKAKSCAFWKQSSMYTIFVVTCFAVRSHLTP